MHRNKKVGAMMSHRLHPPAKNTAGTPAYVWLQHNATPLWARGACSLFRWMHAQQANQKSYENLT